MIRLCRDEDLHALEWDGLFTHHREIIERTYRGQTAGHQVMLLAEVDGKPRGQAWIDLRRGHARSAGVVWAVRVHPDMQSRGLGRKLLREAEAIVRQLGLRAIELSVEVTNDAAQRLYASMGYVVIDRVTERYGYTTPEGEPQEHTLDLLRMRKEIARASERAGERAGQRAGAHTGERHHSDRPLDHRRRPLVGVRGAAVVDVGDVPPARRTRRLRRVPELDGSAAGATPDGSTPA